MVRPLEFLRTLRDKYRTANREAQREFNRSRPIVIEVRLPYHVANEKALRVDSCRAPMTCGHAQSLVEDAVQAAFPGLVDFTVKVRSNPNWRA